jgi:hypothetical protein
VLVAELLAALTADWETLEVVSAITVSEVVGVELLLQLIARDIKIKISV